MRFKQKKEGARKEGVDTGVAAKGTIGLERKGTYRVTAMRTA